MIRAVYDATYPPYDAIISKEFHTRDFLSSALPLLSPNQ